jgi:hypothetical protein
MKYEKPDGVISVQMSGCCCPPGKPRGGQHTNSGTSWIRIDDGEWNPCRSSVARRAALSSETVKEFKERMEKEA